MKFNKYIILAIVTATGLLFGKLVSNIPAVPMKRFPAVDSRWVAFMLLWIGFSLIFIALAYGIRHFGKTTSRAKVASRR